MTEAPLARRHLPSAPLERPVSSARPTGKDGQSRRMKPLMRGYEIAHLTPEGDIAFTTRLAPATPRFERCFAVIGRGALLTTEQGPRAIEDLWPGDRVLTTSHGMQKVLWRGHTTVQPGSEDLGTSLTCLLRVTAGALGPRRPGTDLLLGPAAQIAHRSDACRRLTGSDTALVPARDFVDGDSVLEIRPVSAVEVFQLGLAHHARLSLGGGLEVGSLHPGAPADWARSASDRASLMSLFPHLPGFEAFGPTVDPSVDLRALDF